MLKRVLSLASKLDSSSKKTLPKAPTQAQEVSQKAPTLPANFADEVFNLELEAEHSELDIALISRLLELYAIGIEYYESIKSDKYLIFKNKTKNLLLKQNVNNAMDRATEELKTEPNQSIELDLKKDKIELFFEENDKKNRQKEIELNMKYLQSSDTKESVQSLLDTHSQDIRQNNKIIQHDTDKQKNLILMRLKQRKVKKQGQLDTEECEQIIAASMMNKIQSSQQGRKTSVDLLDLGMDIVDMTSSSKSGASKSVVHTEPNLGRNDHEDLLGMDFSTYQQPSNNYGYEMRIQNQLNKQVIQQQQQQQPLEIRPLQLKPPPTIAAVAAENINALQQSEEEKQATSAKKKKVRVSQKSVMEFQLQNSVIPF